MLDDLYLLCKLCWLVDPPLLVDDTTLHILGTWLSWNYHQIEGSQKDQPVFHGLREGFGFHCSNGIQIWDQWWHAGIPLAMTKSLLVDYWSHGHRKIREFSHERWWFFHRYVSSPRKLWIWTGRNNTGDMNHYESWRAHFEKIFPQLMSRSVSISVWRMIDHTETLSLWPMYWWKGTSSSINEG